MNAVDGASARPAATAVHETGGPLKANWLLTLSGGAYFAVAVVLLFAAEEALALAGAVGSTIVVAVLQLLGAAMFSLAMLNWLNRYSRIGGIFGRPLVVANFVNAMVGALMLLHWARRGGIGPVLGAALGFYTVLAVAFGAKLFGRPPADSGPGC